MSSDFQVILDACVTDNAALRNTLLRLAEPPCSLYLPRCSKDIIKETKQILVTKLDLPRYLNSEQQLEWPVSRASHEVLYPFSANFVEQQSYYRLVHDHPEFLRQQNGSVGS